MQECSSVQTPTSAMLRPKHICLQAMLTVGSACSSTSFDHRRLSCDQGMLLTWMPNETM